ncbi:MAG: hypothetical protein JSS63_10765 [Bacteroidetes bacterium]|nr:hypothetical protein [Bacteroidota bacterium]
MSYSENIFEILSIRKSYKNYFKEFLIFLSIIFGNLLIVTGYFLINNNYVFLILIVLIICLIVLYRIKLIELMKLYLIFKQKVSWGNDAIGFHSKKYNLSSNYCMYLKDLDIQIKGVTKRKNHNIEFFSIIIQFLIENHNIDKIDFKNLENAYIQKALMHFKNKSYNETFACFSKALELNPSNAVIYLCRAAVFFKMNDIEKVISDLHQTLKIDSFIIDAYYGLVICHSIKNEFEKAEQYYNIFINLLEYEKTKYIFLTPKLENNE